MLNRKITDLGCITSLVLNHVRTEFVNNGKYLLTPADIGILVSYLVSQSLNYFEETGFYPGYNELINFSMSHEMDVVFSRS